MTSRSGHGICRNGHYHRTFFFGGLNNSSDSEFYALVSARSSSFVNQPTLFDFNTYKQTYWAYPGLGTGQFVVKGYPGKCCPFFLLNATILSVLHWFISSTDLPNVTALDVTYHCATTTTTTTHYSDLVIFSPSSLPPYQYQYQYLQSSAPTTWTPPSLLHPSCTPFLSTQHYSKWSGLLW